MGAGPRLSDERLDDAGGGERPLNKEKPCLLDEDVEGTSLRVSGHIRRPKPLPSMGVG